MAWYNGSQLVKTAGGVPMGRHVIVNRLEVPQVHRDAFNTTFKCQAANTKLVPPAERTVRLDMLRKYTLHYYTCSARYAQFASFNYVRFTHMALCVLVMNEATHQQFQVPA